MARFAVPLILLVVLAAVVVEGPPPDRPLQNHAVVSNLLQQLFQASQLTSENDQTAPVYLNSQDDSRPLSGQTELTGSEDGKTFDCQCRDVSAWRDPWCAYICQQAIIG